MITAIPVIFQHFLFWATFTHIRDEILGNRGALLGPRLQTTDTQTRGAEWKGLNSRVAARFHASFIATRARKESGQKVHSRAAGSVWGTYIIQYGEDRFSIVIIILKSIQIQSISI